MMYELQIVQRQFEKTVKSLLEFSWFRTREQNLLGDYRVRRWHKLWLLLEIKLPSSSRYSVGLGDTRTFKTFFCSGRMIFLSPRNTAAIARVMKSEESSSCNQKKKRCLLEVFDSPSSFFIGFLVWDSKRLCRNVSFA